MIWHRRFAPLREKRTQTKVIFIRELLFYLQTYGIADFDNNADYWRRCFLFFRSLGLFVLHRGAKIFGMRIQLFAFCTVYFYINPCVRSSGSCVNCRCDRCVVTSNVVTSTLGRIQIIDNQRRGSAQQEQHRCSCTGVSLPDLEFPLGNQMAWIAKWFCLPKFFRI